MIKSGTIRYFGIFSMFSQTYASPGCLFQIINVQIIYFGFKLFGNYWHHFLYFKLLWLAKDHWRGFSTRNAHMVHIINLIRFKNCVYILVEVSFWNSNILHRYTPVFVHLFRAYLHVQEKMVHPSSDGCTCTQESSVRRTSRRVPPPIYRCLGTPVPCYLPPRKTKKFSTPHLFLVTYLWWQAEEFLLKYTVVLSTSVPWNLPQRKTRKRFLLRPTCFLSLTCEKDKKKSSPSDTPLSLYTFSVSFIWSAFQSW